MPRFTGDGGAAGHQHVPVGVAEGEPVPGLDWRENFGAKRRHVIMRRRDIVGDEMKQCGVPAGRSSEDP